MQAGKTPRASASVSTLTRTQPPDDKGGKPAQESPKAAPPRRPLAFYAFQNKTKHLLAALVPGGKRMPAQPVLQAKPDAGIPIYDQLIRQPDRQLSSLMNELIHPYLGTPQQSAEQLRRIEGKPAADQTQQRPLQDLGGFMHIDGIQLSQMQPGVQLMLAPSDLTRYGVQYSPAVFLGLSDRGHILVRSAFQGEAFQSEKNQTIAAINGMPMQALPACDGWGYSVAIPVKSEVSIDFLVKADAPPVALSNEQILRLPVPTRLLIQIPFAGSDGVIKTTAAQPAMFLGAKMADDGCVVLKVRAPWAPAHIGQAGKVAYKHTKMPNHVGKTEMLLRTSGTVPQPASYPIGPGPVVPSHGQSQGWFEWEAPLPAGTVVIADPYFGPMPDLEPADLTPAPRYDALPKPSSSGSSSSAGSTQSGEVGLDSEADVQDTKGPGGSVATPGKLSHAQCINLRQGTPVRLTRGDGETIDAQFAGDADSRTEAPNAIWVIASRDALNGALSGAVRHVPVPADRGSFSYLVSLTTHRLELT